MKPKIVLAYIALVAVSFGLLLVAPVTAENVSPSRVKNRIFQAWITVGNPLDTYQDCLRFSETEVFVAGCGLTQPVGTFTELGGERSLWFANVACPGFTMQLTGLSFDGSRTTYPKPMLAATGMAMYTIGIPSSTTISLHGVEAASCGPFTSSR